MAKTTGSDQLFNLIHAMSPEEKGHFKKFARRHATSGNMHMQLFNAISKQTEFEEKTFRKKFKAYAVMKIYLKDIITDSLTLYHRNHHPHIQIMALIQKVHVLLMKGLPAEASKILSKAIEATKGAEVFLLHKYLLRLQKDLDARKADIPENYTALADRYVSEMQLKDELEQDLVQWEHISLKTTAKLRGTDVFNTKQLGQETERVKLLKVNSKRSEVLKLKTLFELYRMELNQQELLLASKNYADAVSAFKRKKDHSYDDVPAINNYLLTLGMYGDFSLRIKECDNLLSQQRFNQTERNELLVRCVIYKHGALLHQGRFEAAKDFIRAYEKRFMDAIAFTKDYGKLNVYLQEKSLCLFLNRDYAQAWLVMHEIPQYKDPADKINYADLKMLELMTQSMLGNYDQVKAMAKKYARLLHTRKVENYTYKLMLDFFQKMPSGNYKKEAGRFLQQLQDYYQDKNKFPRKLFAILRYTYWLEEIAGRRTIKQCLEIQYGGK